MCEGGPDVVRHRAQTWGMRRNHQRARKESDESVYRKSAHFLRIGLQRGVKWRKLGQQFRWAARTACFSAALGDLQFYLTDLPPPLPRCVCAD